MRVYTICVNGMGSSLILRMTVERALSQLGIDADVEAIDMGSYNGRKTPNLIVTTPALAKNIEPKEGLAIATITNFTDVNAAKENIRAALNLE